jgi:tetratricopeptide (TPR) repeat protein
MDRFSIVKSFVLVCLTLALFPVFPAAGETKPRYISGRILSAAPDGASVVISRGSEDNVVEGTEVIIRENRGEDEAHVEWDFYICKGTVEEIYEDSSLVVVTDSKAPVVPGDYVDVVAEIPVALAEIDLGVIALFDVGIAYYESGMPIYTLGELVENHSPKKIDDIESRFIEEIRLHGPTVESWWPDQKIRGGYFDGMSWTEAYRSTTEEHVETFIEYIRYFPGSYHNRDWNLIYLYGVWVFNETKSAEPEKKRLRADSFVSRGDELVLEGAYNEALSQYKKALEAMPEHPSATERFEMVGILIKNKKIVEQDPGDVDAQFWLGRAYYRLGRYGDALGHLKKARDLGYNYRTVNMNIAYTYSYSGNYTESRKVFEKLHERFPEDEDIRHWLEWVTAREMQEVHGATAESYITTGRLRYREKDYDLAIEEYNKALELDPESQYVWRLIYAASKRSRAHQNQIWAREYWKNGQFETAEYFWENALEICKEIDDEKAQLEILLEMADAMYGSLFYQNAIQTYSRVLDIDPGHYDSIISISNSYESMDQDREAIAWARKGIELEPDNSWGYNVLGYIFLKTGRFEEAADSFSKAVELSLHYNQALYNLGLTYIRMGRYAEAEKQFGAALDVNQDYSLAREKLAALLIISETEPLLRENPGDHENRLRYARALRTLQEYEKSNSELARILRDEPENVVALSYMGYNHSALGNYEKARRYVEKAYRIEPKQNLEAWLFDLEGDIRLKRNPDDPEGYTNLGMADLYWEYYGEALSEFEQAQRLGADPDQIFRLMEMARTGREAKRLYELMYEYLRMGNQDKALESARTAVSLYREIGLRKGSFYATFALGQCLANMFKHQEARRAFDKAKEIAVEQANRVMLAHYHSEIGNYYSNIGDYEKALEHKMEAMDIYHRNNMPGSEAKNTLTWIGYLYSVLGELDRMYDFYHQALEYHEKMRD